MNLELVTSFEQLEELRPAWNELAGNNPFLRWEWMSAWWESFAGEDQLYVLVGRDDSTADELGSVVAIAPWFLGRSEHLAGVIQFLGSGKACSDHLTLLTDPQHRTAFARACADWLDQANRSKHAARNWNSIELIGTDADDMAIQTLCSTLDGSGHHVSSVPGVPCCSIDLANGWDGYFSSRSSSTRRQLRKLLATLDDPTVRVELFTTPEEVEEHWSTFTTLHQRRRRAMNESGCFEHPGFEQFLRSATLGLAAEDLARLYVVFKDDTPISVSHSLVAGDRLFNYQSGMDPDFEELKPGFLMLAAVLKDLERSELCALDLLRGEEPYKYRWRAEKMDTVEIRIPSRRPKALVLHHVWRTKASIKAFVRGEGSGSELEL